MIRTNPDLTLLKMPRTYLRILRHSQDLSTCGVAVTYDSKYEYDTWGLQLVRTNEHLGPIIDFRKEKAKTLLWHRGLTGDESKIYDLLYSQTLPAPQELYRLGRGGDDGYRFNWSTGRPLSPPNGRIMAVNLFEKKAYVTPQSIPFDWYRSRSFSALYAINDRNGWISVNDPVIQAIVEQMTQ